MGGFHLADKSVQQVGAVIAELKRLGVRQVAPCHCTGEGAIQQFKAGFGADFIQAGTGLQIARVRAMLEITVPSRGTLCLEHLLLDVNGTIALDGQLVPGVRERLDKLSETLDIWLVSADTQGTLAQLAAELKAQVRPLHTGGEAALVDELGAERVVALGNGANDAAMLHRAALGIAVLGVSSSTRRETRSPSSRSGARCKRPGPITPCNWTLTASTPALSLMRLPMQPIRNTRSRRTSCSKKCRPARRSFSRRMIEISFTSRQLRA
jgi:soluble P-type ATPase